MFYSILLNSDFCGVGQLIMFPKIAIHAISHFVHQCLSLDKIMINFLRLVQLKLKHMNFTFKNSTVLSQLLKSTEVAQRQQLLYSIATEKEQFCF